MKLKKKYYKLFGIHTFKGYGVFDEFLDIFSSFKWEILFFELTISSLKKLSHLFY
jgi:hypothetical protein